MDKTLLYTAVDGCMVLVHNDCTPSTEEFVSYLEACNEVCESLPSSSSFGVLVFTDGPGPTAKQRALLKDTFTKRTAVASCAVLTHSSAARGMVTALSWLGLNLRAFSPSATDEAFEYLGTPHADRREEARRKLLELRAKLVDPTGAFGHLDPRDLLGKPLAELRRETAC